MLGIDAWLKGLAHEVGVDPAVMRLTVGMVATLAAGSLLRLVWWSVRRGDQRIARLRSLATWWVIVAAIVGSLWAGAAGIAALMAVVGVLAMREWFAVVQPAGVTRAGVLAAFTTIAVQYGCIGAGRVELALTATPAVGAMLILAAAVLFGGTQQFIAGTGAILLGLVLTVYLPSMAAVMAFHIPRGVGWAGLLIVLTLAGDIAAALVGRAIGGPHILPTISPHKTWAGFVGSGCVVIPLSLWLAPALTGTAPATAAGAGVTGWIGCFLGDAALSAVKRDRGVGPSGDMLPGQGGILDRIDSLTFTAPLMLLLAYVCTS